MSREIKFRFWDKTLNKIVYRSLLPYDCEHSEIEVMQFTGFKDKNGKDIYDGDILSDWNEVDGEQVQSKLQVFWSEKYGKWVLDFSYDQDKSGECLDLWLELYDYEYEVTGNIYENNSKNQ